jgi:hypothetical protein
MQRYNNYLNHQINDRLFLNYFLNVNFVTTGIDIITTTLRTCIDGMTIVT